MRKEQIKNEDKKEATIRGIHIALKKIQKIANQSWERDTVTVYPDKIRHEIFTFVPKPPKEFILSLFAANAWAFGRHTPKEIADYIVQQYVEHLKPISK